MRILILGSGAREHAIAWKLKQEIGEDNIYIAPGNAGTQMCGTNIDVNVSDFES
jgi:phosphoribosylamine--glycine ligase